MNKRTEQDVALENIDSQLVDIISNINDLRETMKKWKSDAPPLPTPEDVRGIFKRDNQDKE